MAGRHPQSNDGRVSGKRLCNGPQLNMLRAAESSICRHTCWRLCRRALPRVALLPQRGAWMSFASCGGSRTSWRSALAVRPCRWDAQLQGGLFLCCCRGRDGR